MQTKLKPIFFLATMVATAILLYAANDANAQNPSIGIFDVSAFRPNVITITPKLGRHKTLPPIDTTFEQQQEKTRQIQLDR